MYIIPEDFPLSFQFPVQSLQFMLKFEQFILALHEQDGIVLGLFWLSRSKHLTEEKILSYNTQLQVIKYLTSND